MTHSTEEFEHVRESPGVEGVSYEPQADEVRVFVREKKPEAELADDELIRNQIPDVPTDVREIGEIRAEPIHPPDVPDDSEAVGAQTSGHRSRHRPPVAGASEIQRGGTAATPNMLARVIETDTVPADWMPPVSVGDLVRVSNAHVYGDSVSDHGRTVLQPSPYDGGNHPEDVVGATGGTVPLSHPIVDAAARTIRDEIDSLSTDIHGLDGVTEIYRGDRSVLLGATVRKSGRTTGVTTGEVVGTDATVRVGYGDTSHEKRHQFVLTDISEPGDSGSPVTASDGGAPPIQDEAVIGHMYAGSDRATIAHSVRQIEDALGVRLIADPGELDEPKPPDVPEPPDEPPEEPPNEGNGDGGDDSGGGSGDGGPDEPPERPEPPEGPPEEPPGRPPDKPEPPDRPDRPVRPRPPESPPEGDPGGPYPFGEATSDPDRWHFSARVNRIVDGDTLYVTADLGFKTRRDVPLRIAGVDTGEIYGTPKDSEEFERGQVHKQFVEEWVSEGRTAYDGGDGWPFRIWTLRGSGVYSRYTADIQRVSDGAWLSQALLDEFGDEVRSDY